MRVHITNPSHTEYNRTGHVMKKEKNEILIVRLDMGGPTVRVSKGQWQEIQKV